MYLRVPAEVVPHWVTTSPLVSNAAHGWKKAEPPRALKPVVNSEPSSFPWKAVGEPVWPGAGIAGLAPGNAAASAAALGVTPETPGRGTKKYWPDVVSGSAHRSR